MKEKEIEVDLRRLDPNASGLAVLVLIGSAVSVQSRAKAVGNLTTELVERALAALPELEKAVRAHGPKPALKVVR